MSSCVCPCPYSEQISVIVEFIINHIDATNKNMDDDNGETEAGFSTIDRANAVGK